MGMDEHGPAYPEPPKVYRCPICRGDENRFMTCEYPGCPDGIYQPHRFRSYPNAGPMPHRTSAEKARGLVGWGCFIALLLYLMWPKTAPAMDHGFDPFAPTAKWMHELIQPANPPGSCCGVADSYQADTYQRFPDGSYDVIITDGSAIEFPDGTKRTPLKNGTRLRVPADHVNPPKEQAGNPTGHAWIFLSVYGISIDGQQTTQPGTIYCFVPLPEGS